MSVTTVTEINRRLRAAGITVHEASGWKTRGNGAVSSYVGGLVHHTATGFGKALPGTGVYDLLVSGRPDLDGPLCNYAGNDDGSLTVIAANPANHAGASGGTSMGPLPVTKLFNPRVLGLEIVYPGTTAMRPAQMRTAQVWARIVADVVGGGNIERVRAHAETSVTGKWDPGYASGKTIDMAAFRAAAKQGATHDMDARQEAILVETQKRVTNVAAIVTENQKRIEQTKSYTDTVEARLASIEAKLADLSAGGTVDVLALAAAFADEQDRRARDGNSNTGPVS